MCGVIAGVYSGVGVVMAYIWILFRVFWWRFIIVWCELCTILPLLVSEFRYISVDI